MSDIPEDIMMTAKQVADSMDDCVKDFDWDEIQLIVAKALHAERKSHVEERDRLREENRASKVLLESKDETIRQLTEERAEQWRQRRDAEGSRDAGRAAADSLRIERDALREALTDAADKLEALLFLGPAHPLVVKARAALSQEATDAL